MLYVFGIVKVRLLNFLYKTVLCIPQCTPSMTKRNSPKFLNNAFTLIEVIIYLALFSIVLGGAIVSAFTLIESNDRNQAQTRIGEEANFLLSKMDFYFSSLQTIYSPAPQILCTQNCTVSIARYDQPTLVTFTESQNELFVSENGGMPLELSNKEVAMRALRALHMPADSVTNRRITITFTLSATTSRGVPISQDFETTYYTQK